MKKLLLKLWGLILRMIHNIDNQVDKLIPVATSVVEGVKKAINNPAFDFGAAIVKSLIPGTKDDILIDKGIAIAREFIPKLALQLGIITAISEVEDPREQLLEIFGRLQNVSDKTWQMFCTQLAQQIVVDMADGKITWGEAGVYVELYYQTYLKKAA